jgi:hypothetical protein
MALQTDKIKEGLTNYVNKWNEAFSRDLHKRARFRLDNVLEYIN